MSNSNPFVPNSIVTLFDVNNPVHLAAYRYLDNTGHWPSGFLESLAPAVSIPNGWHIYLQSKIVEAWINHKIGQQT